MRNKAHTFRAVLSGSDPMESCIERLESAPLFKAVVHRTGGSLYAEAYGPKKHHPRQDLAELRSKIGLRAADLNLAVPELVNSTVDKVRIARLAERVVLLGRMRLGVLPSETQPMMEVTLEVQEEVTPDIAACLEHYACWRIPCLAQALNMQMVGAVERVSAPVESGTGEARRWEGDAPRTGA